MGDCLENWIYMWRHDKEIIEMLDIEDIRFYPPNKGWSLNTFGNAPF